MFYQAYIVYVVYIQCCIKPILSMLYIVNVLSSLYCLCGISSMLYQAFIVYVVYHQCCINPMLSMLYILYVICDVFLKSNHLKEIVT